MNHCPPCNQACNQGRDCPAPRLIVMEGARRVHIIDSEFADDSDPPITDPESIGFWLVLGVLGLVAVVALAALLIRYGDRLPVI